MPYLYALFMTFIDIIMMSLLKAKHLGSISGIWIIPLTMALYTLQPILFYFGLSFKTMGIFNVIWNTLSIMAVALTGVYFFGEKLTKYDCIGIFLCISGITFIGLQ